MKDSGIHWIGSIPDTWNVIKVKYNCSLKGRIGWQGLTTDEYIDEGPILITGTDFNVNDGVINWESCVHVSEWRYDQAPEIQVHNGDLLITKDGTVGKVAIVTDMIDKATLNSGVMVIRPIGDTYETKFLYYVLKSEEFWKWFNYINSGNTTISHLYQHDLNHFHFAITDKTEQRAIIDFLDKRCQQVDVIINKVRAQIETLENAKKSLITEKVIAKSSSAHERKDSGVTWIGKIPSSWGVKRIKYVSAMISKGATPKEIEIEQTDAFSYRFLKAENIQNSKLIMEPEHFICKDDYQSLRRSILKTNDLLIVIAGATVGKTAIVTEDFSCSNINQAIAFVRLKDEYRGYEKYFKYVLDSQIKDEVIKGLIVQSAQPNLSMYNIANIKVPVPPLGEAESIAAYLDKRCSVIDRIIEKKQNELRILKEQKKSLINEYITGKKRVKGYV